MDSVSTFLRLIPLNPIEPFLSWEDYCENPSMLLAKFAELYGVEAKFLSDIPSISISGDVPPPEDRSKIWIKTSKPYGIGLMIEGKYQMDYGMNGIPVNTPFLHKDFNVLFLGLRKLTSQEITDFGLTDTVAGAKKRMAWYIFEPGDLQS